MKHRALSFEFLDALVTSGVPAAAMRVAIVIGRFQGQNESAWPNMDTIRARAGADVRTVQRAIADLENAKLLSKIVRPGRSNEYSLHIPGTAHAIGVDEFEASIVALCDPRSPPEAMFARACVSTLRGRCHFSDGRFVLHGGIYSDAWVTIVPQSQVGPYRCDFLLSSSVGRRIDVEIDGHAFHHERTPEQARHDKERDRFMQREGLLVHRYTGSEITSDARRCAAESLLDLVKGLT